jgi:hypothetical protein
MEVFFIVSRVVNSEAEECIVIGEAAVAASVSEKNGN